MQQDERPETRPTASALHRRLVTALVCFTLLGSGFMMTQLRNATPFSAIFPVFHMLSGLLFVVAVPVVIAIWAATPRGKVGAGDIALSLIIPFAAGLSIEATFDILQAALGFRLK